MDRDVAVTMGQLLVTMLRVEKQLAHVTAELDGLKDELFTVGIRLQGADLSYGKELDESDESVLQVPVADEGDTDRP